MFPLLKRDQMLDGQVIQCGFSTQECYCYYLKPAQVCAMIGTVLNGTG